jgi:hypothetical protein
VLHAAAPLGVLDLALCLLAEVVLIAVRFETDGSEAVSPASLAALLALRVCGESCR